jgi:four helix bundle protein
MLSKNKVFFMSKSIIADKSFEFALLVIKLYRQLQDGKEFVISNQLLRSGTSIGANIEEALCGQSKADFIAKLHISLKESCESRYWLRLLKFGNMTKINLDIYLKSIDEIINILMRIIKTTKEKK